MSKEDTGLWRLTHHPVVDADVISIISDIAFTSFQYCEFLFLEVGSNTSPLITIAWNISGGIANQELYRQILRAMYDNDHGQFFILRPNALPQTITFDLNDAEIKTRTIKTEVRRN